MFEDIDSTGVRLDVDTFMEDFSRHWHAIDKAFYKLEVRQSFVEPDNDSWLAYTHGDWAESRRLADAKREELRREVESARFAIRRVRIVEEPWTDYLRWELYVLSERAKAGEDIRVLPRTDYQYRTGQNDGPELVVLGKTVLYIVTYDVDGKNDGAIRVVDEDVVSRTFDEVGGLHAAARPLLNYLSNKPAPL